MSVVKETLIFCDGAKGGLLANDFSCPMYGAYGDGDARSLSAKRQRAGYHLDGWMFIRGKDYCPDCAMKLLGTTVSKERAARDDGGRGA